MHNAKGFFHQFIVLAGPYWNSEHKTDIRNRTFALIVLTIMQIGMAVVINKWSAGLFDALEQRSMADLIQQIGLLVIIFLTGMAITTTHLTVKRGLQIGWRSWLTERVSGQWMDKGRHYQVIFIPGEHDNPDGRIAEDVRIVTEEAIQLLHSLFYSLLLLISFTDILWNLSGTLVVGGLQIQGHLVWIALVYAVSASILGWWVGRPLIEATDARQTVEANFRFGLVKARENSMAIALVHGEANERRRFATLFQDINDVFDRQTRAWRNIMMFTSGYSVLSMAFPVLVSAPRYVLGTISLGTLMQSAQAFQHMASALSWPVDNMAAVANWRASADRVFGLVRALDHLEQKMACTNDPQRICLEKSQISVLGFHGLSLMKQDGEIIASGINAEIRPAERVLINGNSATGAKLFKAIVGLWPWGGGRIELPDDEPMYFMPPRPYLPSGTLRTAICYPNPVEDFTKAAIKEALKKVGLGELQAQLDTTENWETALTREQQQRLGAVRLLLNHPKWILLQEAFDSLDPQGEVAMLRLISDELPEAAMLTITNQPTADAFHQRRIVLP
ncbi:ABC transporter ATP-binding protein/permease [Methylomicrobium sp. Wu6]|uniref:ABC transporter ATP-binding protein/permease n=1 Tax=Methylomicrobium sp. Wu6 TaxID=3107928 RepID=UPI002DD67B40|nr:ABC transporter ATP-binding protein/permease [Methylomicrobium sp. Wu6]MEC4747551.1 ABC transporter ATP-binding protein/permease [Methylomicrobium sp. Wu6]